MKKGSLFFWVTFFFLGQAHLVSSEPIQPFSREVAHLQQQFPPAQNKPRIRSLIPKPLFSLPLGIDPCLPESFIMMTDPAGADPSVAISNWFYWGEKTVLERYFEDPTDLKGPIIKLRLHPTVMQVGPRDLVVTNTPRQKPTKKTVAKLLSSEKGMLFWGSYPVVEKEYLDDRCFLCSAVIGLNHPSGFALFAELQCPTKDGVARQQGLDIWKNLMAKTTQLSEREQLLSFGQDLHVGYTWRSFPCGDILFVAERRNRDGLMRLYGIPCGKQLSLKKRGSVETGEMGLLWQRGKPMVKVSCQLRAHQSGKETFKAEFTESVIIKSVDEFSINQDEFKKKNAECIFFEKKMHS